VSQPHGGAFGLLPLIYSTKKSRAKLRLLPSDQRVLTTSGSGDGRGATNSDDDGGDDNTRDDDDDGDSTRSEPSNENRSR